MKGIQDITPTGVVGKTRKIRRSRLLKIQRFPITSAASCLEVQWMCAETGRHPQSPRNGRC